MFLSHIIVVMIIYQRNMYDEVVILLLAVMLFSYYYIVNSMPYKHHWLLLSDDNINIAIFIYCPVICEGSTEVIFLLRFYKPLSTCSNSNTQNV